MTNSLINHLPHSTQQLLASRMIAHQVPVERQTWQSTIAPSPAHELSNVILEFQVPDSIQQWQNMCKPDLPWAETHFQERVSDKTPNPPPSYVDWPWHSKQEAEKFIREGGRFDHTYPERYWPRAQDNCLNDWGADSLDGAGDLQDVVRLLRKDAWTRQAYLPVWYPEDTGAAQNQRVPCTLGYHFIRNGPSLDCNYFIRSCDLTRHYKNDIYLTGRLLQWMVEKVHRHAYPYTGTLTVFISNLHLFTADAWRFQ